MTHALAMFLREKSFDADLAAAAASPADGASFGRTYAIVAGRQAEPLRERARNHLRRLSHLGQLDVFIPKELASLKGDIGDASAYADYLGETLWRKQVSKEFPDGMGIFIPYDNGAALLAAAAVTATEPRLYFWEPQRGDRYVNVSQPAGRILNRLLHPIYSAKATSALEEILG